MTCSGSPFADLLRTFFFWISSSSKEIPPFDHHRIYISTFKHFHITLPEYLANSMAAPGLKESRYYRAANKVVAFQASLSAKDSNHATRRLCFLALGFKMASKTRSRGVDYQMLTMPASAKAPPSFLCWVMQTAWKFEPTIAHPCPLW